MIITIEFIGSLQKLFNTKKFNIEIDKESPLIFLIKELENSLPENKKFPAVSNILIMNNGREINSLKGLQTVLSNNDCITFIPVSHGG